uniref:Uncharacterized protein n=1 Tax=Anopheles darlingi TaxID=43151 RepID=A0A2M4D0T4_ANODA
MVPRFPQSCYEKLLLLVLRCSVSFALCLHTCVSYTLIYATAMPCCHNICLLNRAHYAQHEPIVRSIDRSKRTYATSPWVNPIRFTNSLCGE